MSMSDPIPLKSLNSTPQDTPALPHLNESSSNPANSRETLTFPQTSSQDGSQDPESPLNFIAALPPVDTGRQAWSFLVAATILETLIWGLPYVVGIFHEFWISEMFKDQGGESIITLAATLQTGLMYMSVAVFGP